MINRTTAAFRFSVRKFCDRYPKAFFWTFTFREVHHVKDAAARWKRFADALLHFGRNSAGQQTITGIRVFEMHENHGLHIHCLINRRVDIRTMRKMAERHGFWWIHVEAVTDAEKCGEYLAKYLSKADRPKCLKGFRLWAAWGRWGHTKCTDVQLESEFCEAFRKRRQLVEMEDAMRKSAGVPNREETNLETFFYAHRHVLEVMMRRRPPLLPHLWSFSEPLFDKNPDADFEDWLGVWSALDEPFYESKGRAIWQRNYVAVA